MAGTSGSHETAFLVAPPSGDQLSVANGLPEGAEPGRPMDRS